MTANDLLRYCINSALARAHNQGIEEAARLIEEAYGSKSANYVRTLKKKLPSPPAWGPEDLGLKPDDRDTSSSHVAN